MDEQAKQQAPPASPISALAAAAAQLHELYTAYVDAGFTQAQAMQMICTTLAIPPRNIEQ